MSSVPRATFNSYKSDLDTRLVGAVSDFAAERSLIYDRDAIRAHCGWTHDASVDILMFGLDTFPIEDDDNGGQPVMVEPAAFAVPTPANDSSPWRPVLLAASLALAVCASMWGIGAVDDVDAAGGPELRFVHDATLPVTSQSALLPDAVG